MITSNVLFCRKADSRARKNTNICINRRQFSPADGTALLQVPKNNRGPTSPTVTKSVVMDICTKKSMSGKSVFLMNSPLVSVSTCKILGCIFSSDLKWNAFVDFLVKKASKRLYLIISLKRSDCPDDLLFRAYCAFIRPVLLYAFPAVCNMPTYLSRKLLKIENRVLRIIKSEINFPCLFSVADKMCLKLINQILLFNEHPLRSFFVNRHNVPCLRNVRSILKPKAKTKRFSSSLVRYCN